MGGDGGRRVWEEMVINNPRREERLGDNSTPAGGCRANRRSGNRHGGKDETDPRATEAKDEQIQQQQKDMEAKEEKIQQLEGELKKRKRRSSSCNEVCNI